MLLHTIIQLGGSSVSMSAIFLAISRSPPFFKYAVIPVPLNVWKHIFSGSPAEAARRFIILKASLARNGSFVCFLFRHGPAVLNRRAVRIRTKMAVDYKI